MTAQRILVLDDDASVVDFLCESLTTRGYAPVGMTSPLDALARIKIEEFDLVITDVEMPKMRGVELLAKILESKPSQLVLLMTAFGSIDLAVSVVREGACDFVTKPFKIEQLVFSIERAFRDRQMRREIVRLRSAISTEVPGQVVAKSPAMRKVVEIARRAARSATTVLLTGETGTGKSAIARFIHSESPRAAKPFIHLNCAALPPNLIESELFGVRRGAFTDAREDRAGAFVSAADGTVFLDEIGELPLDLQAKLLHVLEAGKVRPLGGTSEVTLRAQVIAATNRPLEVLLREGSFRPDLYYRLNVIRIEVPPLRERREDIVPLVDLFLAQASQRQLRPLFGVSSAAMKRLLGYAWPGNVRELSNLIERGVALSENDTLLPEDLDFPSAGDDVEAFLGGGLTGGLSLEALERAYVQRVLDAQGGNKAAAARILQINRRTLYRKLGLVDL